MKKLLFVAGALCAFGGTAMAQDTTTDTPMASTTGGGDPSMGIETEWNTAGDLPFVHFLYNLGGNWIDAGVGLGITNISPDVGDSATQFAISLLGGYRMYQDMDGRIHPYLEPYVNFGLVSDSGNPPTINTYTQFGAGAMLGVDLQVFDQFSLGAAVGGGLNFRLDKDPVKENVLDIGVYTTSINATFKWGG